MTVGQFEIKIPFTKQLYWGHVLFNTIFCLISVVFIYRSSPDRNFVPMATGFLALVLSGIVYFSILKGRWRNFSKFLIRARVMAQAAVQFSLLFLISLYDKSLAEFIWYLPFFVFFAFLCEYFVLLLLNRPAQIGLYVFSLVFSINLFLRISPDQPILLFLLIIVGVFAKNFLTRENNSDWKHLFNPSAFAIALLYIAIILKRDLFVGLAEVRNLLAVPYFDFALILFAAFTLWLPNSFIIPIAGVATVAILDVLTRQIFGVSLMFGLARGQILLGFCLLITDPMTSPKTQVGKLFFGISYALSICFAYWFLVVGLSEAPVFNKILAAPILNIAAPYFDWVEKAALRLTNFSAVARLLNSRLAMALIYFAGFGIYYESLERLYPAPYFLESVVTINADAKKLELKAIGTGIYEDHIWYEDESFFGTFSNFIDYLNGRIGFRN